MQKYTKETRLATVVLGMTIGLIFGTFGPLFQVVTPKVPGAGGKRHCLRHAERLPRGVAVSRKTMVTATNWFEQHFSAWKKCGSSGEVEDFT